MAVGFLYEDSRLAVTPYWQAFRQVVQARSDYTTAPGPTDWAFPWEDIVLESNWPRYGALAPAFGNETVDMVSYRHYLADLLGCRQPLCILNMMPYAFTRDYVIDDQPIALWPYLAQNPHVILADGCLTHQARARLPHSISLPALPLTVGAFDPAAKTILASFRGAASHPTRRALTAFNALPGYRCEIVDPHGYVEKIDALGGIADPAYEALLNDSVFAFVPRGDCHFSYRLLEVMSFGCIPIILSDDWVLPFDRTIPWRNFALHIPEAATDRIPRLLAKLSPDTLATLQTKVQRAYQNHLANFSVIVETLLTECAMLGGTDGG